MPTNSSVERSDAQALIPEDASRDIIQGAVEQSAVLSLARRLPDMPRDQRRMPVLSSLPFAYFVTGDTGLKQTSKMAWDNKYLNAEELAVIFPIPEAVLSDSAYDMWAEIRPRASEAIGKVFDRAVFFGENAPSSWPTNIYDAAVSAGNGVTIGTGADLYEDIMGENGVISAVELDGYMPNGSVGAMSMRGKLRSVRTSEGGLIFKESMQQAGSYTLDGQPIMFPRNGSILSSDDALLFTGDFSQIVYAVRQDLTWSVANQAVIQDNSGNIVFNLFQQDMVALRVVLRIAWQVPNPINHLQEIEANRYPVAVLKAS